MPLTQTVASEVRSLSAVIFNHCLAVFVTSRQEGTGVDVQNNCWLDTSRFFFCGGFRTTALVALLNTVDSKWTRRIGADPVEGNGSSSAALTTVHTKRMKVPCRLVECSKTLWEARKKKMKEETGTQEKDETILNGKNCLNIKQTKNEDKDENDETSKKDVDMSRKKRRPDKNTRKDKKTNGTRKIRK